MTQQQKSEIKLLTQERIAAKALSNNQASKQMGVSAALLSNLLNDKWDQISDQMWLKVSAWAGYQISSWTIFETRNTKAINELCEDAKSNSRFLAVAGDTGLGKTTALKYFSSNRQNAFYVLCTVTMSRKDFLTAILQSIGLESEGSLHNRTMNIVNKLSTLEAPVLILDDFGKLSDSCVRMIQLIYDGLEGRCGIVIAGLNYMKDQIFRNATKDKPGYRELKRRIGYWQPLYGITRSFINTVCQKYGITDDPALRFVEANCHDYGTLKELIMNYRRMVERKPELLSEGSQREVLASLHVGASNWEAAA